MKYYGYIYKYTSPNGKVYIGKTNNECLRKSQHKSDAKRNPKTYFHKAIKKYGFENFSYETIFQTVSDSKEKLDYLLNVMEQYFIRKFQSNNPIFGYNLTAGGEGILNVSKESREKISNALKGKSPSKEAREKISKTLKTKFKSKEIDISNRRKIVMYDSNNIELMVFDSITEAAKHLNKKSNSSIGNILGNRAKHTKEGYTFAYL